eukprot:5555569-Karenia_brevis.AAC.1
MQEVKASDCGTAECRKTIIKCAQPMKCQLLPCRVNMIEKGGVAKLESLICGSPGLPITGWTGCPC